MFGWAAAVILAGHFLQTEFNRERGTRAGRIDARLRELGIEGPQPAVTNYVAGEPGPCLGLKFGVARKHEADSYVIKVGAKGD